MSDFVHIARQSIISSDSAVYGYEVLYRNQDGVVDLSLTERTLTANVILSVFNLIGRERSVGEHIAFFNVDQAILLTDIIEALPKDQCIFELNSYSSFGTKELENIQNLHSLGYRFALDNFIVTDQNLDKYAKLLRYITYIKIDVQSNDVELVADKFNSLKQAYKLIAHKVETKIEFDTYKQMGFDYFQGFYIQYPVAIKHYKMQPRHLGLTRLFKLIHDVPIQEFAKEFERHNELCIQFFQYIISTGMYRYNASNSVRDVIVEAGVEMIERWMMLIVYAKGSHKIDDKRGALSLFFIRRLDLMNTIVSNVHIDNRKKLSDELKLLAIFSILRDIYKVPFDSILDSFELDENLELWLIIHKGRFELIYKALKMLETKEIDEHKLNSYLLPFKINYQELKQKLPDL